MTAEVVALKRYTAELTIRTRGGNEQRGRIEIDVRSAAVRLFLEGGNWSPLELLHALNNLAAHFDARAILGERREPGRGLPRLMAVTGGREENPVMAVVDDVHWLFGVLHTARDNGGFTSSGNLRLDFATERSRWPDGF